MSRLPEEIPVADLGRLVDQIDRSISPSLSLPCLASRPSSNAGIAERTARGRADAKAKGVKFGRKPTLTAHQQQEARERLAAGETQRSVASSEQCFYGVHGQLYSNSLASSGAIFASYARNAAAIA